MPEKIIEIHHLAKHFGKIKAVEDVTFDVYRGDVFGFLGPNGAGKSTTIRTLLSLIKPTAGEIRLFGKELSTHRSDILRRIGCIVEKPDFYKYLSAERNLQIFGRISGATISNSRVQEMLEFVGLKGREKEKVGGYSHGMRQRLGLAQTLLHDPEMIILDEPTTGLDPQGIIDIRHLILRLKHERNKTVVLSSHILSEMELIADRLVIINKGKTVVQGNVAELLSTADLIVAFDISDRAKALSLVQAHFPEIQPGDTEDKKLHLHIPQERIPAINKLFCDHGVDVFSIESRRRLEDYFLKLVSA